MHLLTGDTYLVYKINVLFHSLTFLSEQIHNGKRKKFYGIRMFITLRERLMINC